MLSSGSGLIPNFNAWLQTAWGAGAEFWSAGPTGFFGTATNLVFGQNPPYYLDTFLAFYPKFFGPAQSFNSTGSVVNSNALPMNVTTGLLVGQFLQASGFPPNTIITGVAPTGITVNNGATATQGAFSFSVYTMPPVPLAVVQLYLNLAYASLVQCRWQEQWTVAMGWFIAHYLTLWARSDAVEVIQLVQASIHGETPTGAVPGTVYTLSAIPTDGVLQGLYKNGQLLTPGVSYTLSGLIITLTAPTVLNDVLYATWPVQVTTQTAVPPSVSQLAAQGLASGILTSKSVGDVSASYSVLESLKEFGQWNLTFYGQQLATMAKVIGSGPMVVWSLALGVGLTAYHALYSLLGHPVFYG